MTNKTPRVNSSGDVATPYGKSEKVPRHHDAHQFSAMNAALMVGSQYSHESKSHFRRQCLSHLKASLAAVQDVSV